MKTLKLKYVIGSLITGLISIISIQNLEKYGVGMFITFGLFFILSLAFLISDRKLPKKEFIVVDSKTDETIKSFVVEEEAIEFANEQDKDTKVVMVML